MIWMGYVILIAFLTFGFVICDGDGKWGFRTGNFSNPSNWKDHYKSCGGFRQSPININTNKVKYSINLKPVNITQLKSVDSTIFKKSDMTINLGFSDSWKLSFGRDDCYRPISMHWHWGADDSKGSEHTINDFMNPIEGHLVTYNCKLYDNATSAMIYPSGLHVFGVLYKIGKDNPAIAKLDPSFEEVKSTGEAKVKEISPILLLPNNLEQYYRYEGSLTTPPCTENVIWTVFNEIQTISSSQIKLFRSLMYGKPESGPMVDNFRPVLPVVTSPEYIERVVYASFNGSCKCGFGWILLATSVMIVTSFIS